MINIKPDVVSALKGDGALTGLLGGDRIYLSIAPIEEEFPRITYYEADNADHPLAEELEALTEVLMVIDVWNKGSTSDIAENVDRIMAGLGFYREFAADLYEKETYVYHKSLRYRKLRLFDGDPGSLPVDPWIEALAEWTGTNLGAGWTICRNIFPVNYARPAVIWIVTAIQVKQKTSAAFDVSKSFTGVVLGGVPGAHVGAAVSITQGLANDIKIPLDLADRRYLTVVSAQTAINAESLTVALVKVDLTRVTLRPTQDVPTIGQVIGSPGQVNT